MKQMSFRDIVQIAKARGLFVLAESVGRDLSYKFWDVKTGKWALTYYPASKRWLSGTQKEGTAPTVEEAIAAVRGTARLPSAVR